MPGLGLGLEGRYRPCATCTSALTLTLTLTLTITPTLTLTQADISPVIGWETGRPSVPQYMDMNLHSVRGDSRPSVCVYQHDLADPMNPLGLLIAYQVSPNPWPYA